MGRIKRIWQYPVVIATVFMGVVWVWHASAADTGKVLVPESGVYFGIAPGSASDVDIANYEVSLGRGFDIQRVVSDKAVPDLTGDGSQVQDAIRNNRIPWLSITTKRWDQVANGQHGGDIDALAEGIKSLDVPMYLTINYEPEDDLSNQQTVENYRAVWQRYHARFAELGVTNVSWAYIVKDTSLNTSDPLYASATAMYPGDEFVDWIGVDTYNMPYDVTIGYDHCKSQGQNEPKAQSTAALIEDHDRYPCQSQYYATNALDTQWINLKTRVQTAYTWVTQTKPGSHVIPMALAEWGSTYDWRNDSRRAEWIDTASEQLKTLPQIKAIAYAQTAEWMVGWPPGVNSGADAAALTEMANDPYYNPRLAKPPDLTPPSVTITTQPGIYHGTVTVNAEATDNVRIDRVSFLANDVWLGTDQTAPYQFARDTTINDDGTYQITAMAYDKAGNATQSVPVSIVVDNFSHGTLPTIESFIATPSTITVGETTTLSWITTASQACSITPSGPTDTMASSWTTPQLTQPGTVEYTLTCHNANGAVTKTTTLTVNPAPTPPAKPILSANHTQVMPGESVMLSWSSAGATNCTLQPGDIEALGEVGSALIEDMQETTTFNLTCRNDIGEVSADPLTITVTEEPQIAAPRILSFVISPNTIPSGATAMVSWQTNNVTTNGCSISPTSFSQLPATGAGVTQPLTVSQTYTLACQNEVGQIDAVSEAVTIDGQPAPVAPAPLPPPSPEPPAEATVETATGEEVANTQVDDTVEQGTPLTLTARTIVNQTIIENIEKIEFYINGKLVQTTYEPPFMMNTENLEPGTYTITAKIYAKDGAVAIRSQVVTIVESPSGLAFFVALVAAAVFGCLVWTRQSSKQ